MAKKKTKSQIGRMSRVKGKNFERRIAKILEARGFEARRALQYDGLLDHDLKTNLPFNFECKAVERLNIYQAMEQSRGDSHRKGTHPTVVHKKNNCTPLITMDFNDFLDLLQWALGYVDEVNGMDLTEIREELKQKRDEEKAYEELL